MANWKIEAEWNEKDHASARCEASRMDFKLEQVAETRSIHNLISKLLKEGNTVSSTLFEPGRNQWLAFPENQHTESRYSCHCLYVLQKIKIKIPRFFFYTNVSQISSYLTSLVSDFQKPALPEGSAINSIWQKLIISSLEFSISVHFFHLRKCIKWLHCNGQYSGKQ